MPTLPATPGPFTGLPAELASLPLDQSVRGGMNGPQFGIIDGPSQKAAADQLGLNPGAPIEEEDPFAGMGPLLEDDDAKVFQTLDGLVMRQEIIALNHLAQDAHWTYVKLGYPWSTLTKEPTRDRYTQSLPYGSAGITIQAVPNKAWDLNNKTTEALLVDFPVIECEPGDDSDDAENACDLANRFLSQDAGEQGTNDAVLWNDRVAKSLVCASSYIEYWSDPTGGGYVPLRIPAHPEAESPASPMLGPDGMPTTSPIERYVTGPINPDGTPGEGSRFTTDPTKAAPQWQPKLRASKWQREHIRCYPETAPVENAEKVIILGYCTLSEGKKRWPKLAAMGQDELSKLCDWTPPRYLALLPLFQRGRWQLTDGRDKAKAGSSDERIFFYYHCLAKASPDHKKGADVVVTGALNKLVIDKKLLSVDVEVPVKPEAPKGNPLAANLTTPQQAQPPAPPETRKEIRCREIPVVQVTPRQDPDEQDPTGRAYIEMLAGAIENNAHLAMSASEIIDKNLHLEGYSRSVSPISGQQREDARATGDIIPVLTMEDIPKWGTPIPFENAFFNFFEISDQATNSIGSAERAAKGQDNAGEKSGKAIQLATNNNNVSLGGMNHAINNAYARAARIKLEIVMSEFTTQQMIAYVGEDGIFKQEAFVGMDLALVGKTVIKDGTGGLLAPETKVQNLSQLALSGMLTPDEAKDAARPAYSQKLGLKADPASERIERQITTFNKGIPNEEWLGQWATYQQQNEQFMAQQERATMAAANTQRQGQHNTATIGAPPPDIQPVQTALKPPVKPWTPFVPMPTDEQPANAALRLRRLGRLIDSAKFESFPGEWQQVVFEEYERMNQIGAAAAQAQLAAQQPPPKESKEPKPQPQGAAA